MTERGSGTPIQERLSYAFDAIIEELKANPRVKQPTKLEQVIEVFKNQGGKVEIEDLVPLFEKDTADSRQAASNLVAKLNTKLESFGVRLDAVVVYKPILLNEEDLLSK